MRPISTNSSPRPGEAEADQSVAFAILKLRSEIERLRQITERLETSLRGDDVHAHPVTNYHV
jgi:hypothetical protein